jgi:hypothetical protein
MLLNDIKLSFVNKFRLKNDDDWGPEEFFEAGEYLCRRGRLIQGRENNEQIQ